MDIPVTRPTRLVWPLWLNLVIGVIVVGYLTLMAGLMIWSWSGPWVRSLTKYVPVPVGWVGSHPIWAATIFTQASALDVYNAYQQSAQLPTVGTTNTLASGFTKSIKDRVDESLMAENHLSVSPADIDQTYATEVSQAGASSHIEKTLQDLYGWTPAEFKRFVIKIDLSRDRLREKYSFDNNLNKSAQGQATTVRQQIAADGSNMGEIATRYSQDAYAANGGVTDFIKRGELVQELDQAAFQLEIGSISDIIHTKYGFHIIQVMERKGDGDSAEVKLRSIFIATPSVEDAEKKFLSEHQPRVFIRSLRWDAATAMVVER